MTCQTICKSRYLHLHLPTYQCFRCNKYIFITNINSEILIKENNVPILYTKSILLLFPLKKKTIKYVLHECSRIIVFKKSCPSIWSLVTRGSSRMALILLKQFSIHLELWIIDIFINTLQDIIFILSIFYLANVHCTYYCSRYILLVPIRRLTIILTDLIIGNS